MEGLMIHVCTIYLPTSASTADGGPVVVDGAAVKTAWPCRIQPASGKDQVKYARRSIVLSHVIYFADDPQVDERHIITFARGVKTVRLRVVEVKNFDEADQTTAAIPNYWKVMCSENNVE